MSTLKTVLPVRGIVLVMIGLMFLPSRNYVFDKGDQSAFVDVTELGAFVETAVAMIAVGAVTFGLSFIIRGRSSD